MHIKAHKKVGALIVWIVIQHFQKTQSKDQSLATVDKHHQLSPEVVGLLLSQKTRKSSWMVYPSLGFPFLKQHDILKGKNDDPRIILKEKKKKREEDALFILPGQWEKY